MTPVFTEKYFLSASEANAEQELSLPILTSKLIDIATSHANSLGIGNPSMEDIHAGWVLSRLSIEMSKYPKVNDNYKISTWIEATNRHYSERAFRIEGEDGTIYGYARSVWMVIDTENHQNVGLSHLEFKEEWIDGSVPPIERQARHLIIMAPDEIDSDPGKGVILATHPVFDYRFKYCDLDFYRHVNTVRYVILLLNRFSLDNHDTYFIHRLELSFMHEAKYGMDTQLMRCDDKDGLRSSFLLRKSDDKTPLLYARIIRQPRK